MGNLFLVAFSMIFAFSIFHQNIVYSGVNRVYLGLYKGVAESGVITYGRFGNLLDAPYFSVDATKAAVNSYFESSLKRYVQTYKANYLFYNENGVIDFNLPRSFSVTLKCDISAFQKFERIAYFTLQENK